MARAAAQAVPSTDNGSDVVIFSDAEWLDWNCRGYYLANGMEPPISAESMAARPALGLTSEPMTLMLSMLRTESTAR